LIDVPDVSPTKLPYRHGWATLYDFVADPREGNTSKPPWGLLPTELKQLNPESTITNFLHATWNRPATILNLHKAMSGDHQRPPRPDG